MQDLYEKLPENNIKKKIYFIEEIKSILKFSKENNIHLFVLGNGTIF